jgi:hypothetical protein
MSCPLPERESPAPRVESSTFSLASLAYLSLIIASGPAFLN